MKIWFTKSERALLTVAIFVVFVALIYPNLNALFFRTVDPDFESLNCKPIEFHDTRVVVPFFVSDQVRVSLNGANAEELQGLPGIGPVLAERIREFRETQGKFESAEDLLEVKGIGPVVWEKINNLVTFKQGDNEPN